MQRPVCASSLRKRPAASAGDPPTQGWEVFNVVPFTGQTPTAESAWSQLSLQTQLKKKRQPWSSTSLRGRSTHLQALSL